MYVHEAGVGGWGGNMPWCTCGGQLFGVSFSPSNLTWVLGDKLRSPPLRDKHFSPLTSSPQPSPCLKLSALWLPTQVLPDSEPVKFLYVLEGRAHKAHPTPRGLTGS